MYVDLEGKASWDVFSEILEKAQVCVCVCVTVRVRVRVVRVKSVLASTERVPFFISVFFYCMGRMECVSPGKSGEDSKHQPSLLKNEENTSGIAKAWFACVERLPLPPGMIHCCMMCCAVVCYGPAVR